MKPLYILIRLIKIQANKHIKAETIINTHWFICWSYMIHFDKNILIYYINSLLHFYLTWVSKSQHWDISWHPLLFVHITNRSSNIDYFIETSKKIGSFHITNISNRFSKHYMLIGFKYTFPYYNITIIITQRGKKL